MRALALVVVVGCGARTGTAMHVDASVDASVEDVLVPPMDAGMPDARPPCTPQSCKGCCDQTGACQDGNSLDACGVRGEPCELCAHTPDSLCNKPVPGCVLQLTRCNAASCGGCCIHEPMPQLEFCSVRGKHDEACGHGAMACQTCTNSQHCVPFMFGGGMCQ